MLLYCNCSDYRFLPRVAVNFSVTSSVLWDVLKKKKREEALMSVGHATTASFMSPGCLSQTV